MEHEGEAMSIITCQRCGQETHGDDRTVLMACGYEMDELKLPFGKVELPTKDHFYALSVCKQCRSDWMVAIKQWFEHPTLWPETGTGVYVRRFGANLELTEEQIKEQFPDGDCVRVLK